MNLCVDIGNSKVKMAVYKGPQMVDYIKVMNNEFDQLAPFLGHYSIKSAVLSTVRKDNTAIMETIAHIESIEFITHESTLPIKLNYETPHTLGIDRITAALGAKSMFDNENCIIIDIGTCITLDFLSGKNIFEGGNISPGMRMRLRAMHEMTSKLPHVEDAYNEELLGKSTKMALQNGAFYGIYFEILGFIQEIEQKHPHVKVILTGGGALEFVELLGSKIFVHPFLILDGLNYLNENNA